MIKTIQIGSRLIESPELLSLLSRYQLLPELVRNIIIDQAIADIYCTQSEQITAIVDFEQQHQIVSDESRAAWLQKRALTIEEMEEIAVRTCRIEKFKAATWIDQINSYFLTRKPSLDQVAYSIIRTKYSGVANGIYFRIINGEQSFEELARHYSEGSEALTGGLLGPVPLDYPHPAISKLLSASKPGQLWSPCYIDEWFFIVRLEMIFPAQLDESMRHRLLDELFETWIQEQIKAVQYCLVSTFVT